MPNNLNNHDQLELLETALRGGAPPEEPLSPELQARIVGAFRTESRPRRGALTLRRFTVAAALAASLLLAITILVMNRSDNNLPGSIGKVIQSDHGVFGFAKIPPAPVIVDDSMAAVEEFATNSVVQEIRYLARDASEIGIAMLAAIPGDVVGRGDSNWWSGSVEK